MKMNPDEISGLLSRLIESWENEVVEFKNGVSELDGNTLGEYFSALANEANLRGLERGWLVLGVDDKKRSACGVSYEFNEKQIHENMMRVRQGTGSFTFRDIHILNHPNDRVILFEIPAAPAGIPISWNGHYYGRAGANLAALQQNKIDEIRSQTLVSDWSAQVVAEATIEDLDENALNHARKRFAEKHENRFSLDEVESFTALELLNRARITDRGKITRTALLLLGKAESAGMLSPNPAEISWKRVGEDRVYEHFRPPFLLATTQLYSLIHNPQLQILPENGLIPHKVAKYDQRIVLEALHNCIAHQNYSSCGRILVMEYSDRVVFENDGHFIVGHPDDYVLNARTPRQYRNAFLTQAMAEIGMIDRMGYGISDIYERQRKRYLPLPDYDLESEADVVRLTIHGQIVDEAYTRILTREMDLPLSDVLALDRIQKGLTITKEAARHLRRNRLIEGRMPNVHISSKVAAVTARKAEYIRIRSQSDAHCVRMVISYLKKFSQANRSEIDKILFKELSDALSSEQKRRRISSILTKMRRGGDIENTGSRRAPVWKLINDR